MKWLTNWFKDRMRFSKTRSYAHSIIEIRTQRLLVTHVYQQSLLGQVTSLFCASIIFLGLYNSENHINSILISWFIYTLIVALCRIGLSYLYQNQSSPEKKVAQWKTLFVIGTFLGGLSWGFAGSYLFWFANDIQQTLIILIIAGITSGAVPLLSADLLAALTFLVVTLIPLIIQLFLQYKNSIYLLFNMTVIVYFIYMIILSLRSHQLLKQTIGLQFEKEALTKELHEKNEQVKMIESKLNLVETHDLSTGLANRKLFMITLTEAIKRAEISQKNLALFYMDLDNFKFVNDAYGYEVGDQLLNLIISRVKEHLRETDFFARLGGDKLAIIFENQTNISSITRIAKQMCELSAKPFHLGEYHINMSVSIGVSVYPIDGVQANTLVKKAELAMRYVKEHGHNNFHFHTTFSEPSS